MLYRTASSRPQPRRGIVLVAVLLVVTVLALAAYHYSELMAAEYKASASNTRARESHRAALSGIAYVMAILADANFFNNNLGYNPYDNPQYFQDILVQDNSGNSSSKKSLHFSIISLRNPEDPLSESQPYRFGVLDEAGKLNLNALLKYDSTGNVGLQMLTAVPGLPNTTDDIANSILDWLDGTSTQPRSGGAKDDYYMGLSPPYHCKNGPIDSYDELLSIQNVTSGLIWGSDTNKNGQQDPGETGGLGNATGNGAVDRGWSPYLTLYSREANISSTGQPRVYVNDPSLSTLQTNLTAVFGSSSSSGANAAPLINFILAARIWGAQQAPGGGGGSGASGGGTYTALSASDQSAVITAINNYITTQSNSSSGSSGSSSSGGGSGGGAGGGGGKTISSLYSLINATVSVQVPTGMGMQTKTVTLPSPLTGTSNLATMLPPLLDLCTTSQNPDLTARINVNTASETVLMMLVANNANNGAAANNNGAAANNNGAAANGNMQSSSGLQASDVYNIIANQPTYTDGTMVDYQTYYTPAWLITQANVSPQAVQSIQRYITARSTVFSFQVLGYYHGGGPVTRLEVVIDTNYGRPRLLYLRNLTQLGKAFDMTQIYSGQ